MNVERLLRNRDIYNQGILNHWVRLGPKAPGFAG